MQSVEVTLYLTAVGNRYLRWFNQWVSGTKGTHLGVGVGRFVYHVTADGFKRTRLVNFIKCNKVQDKITLKVSQSHLQSTLSAFESKSFSRFRFNYNCLIALFRRSGLRPPRLKQSQHLVTCADFPSMLFRGTYCSHYQIPGETFDALKQTSGNIETERAEERLCELLEIGL